jgi:hypothetical protein
MSAELTSLKQEVAELWSRYRKEEPRPADDEGRRALAELNRTLEAKRRGLADRSAALRLELEQHRRRASRLSPVVRVFGGMIGSAFAAAVLGSFLPECAELSNELSVGQGVVALSVALLMAAVSVSRAD